MTILHIAGDGGEYISLLPKSYEHLAAPDSDDANQLVVRTVVACGGFRGEIETSFRTHDFVMFLDDLEKLSRLETGAVTFLTSEKSLEFSITIDAAGQTEIVGRLRDIQREGVMLSFAYHADQSYFPAMRASLLEMVAAFPVRDPAPT